MERRSTSDLSKQLEPLLRKFEDDENLTIEDVEEEAGCKAGDNYMSIVMQTVVKGSRGNGTIYRKSFMTKYLPIHREITNLFRTVDLFHNESYFYDKLLPSLSENLAPTCVNADSNKIIMEDLRSLGYGVLDRRDLLDLDHCVATVETLARLHASSLALKLLDIQAFTELTKPLKEGLFPQNDVASLGASIKGSLRNAVHQLESLNSSSEDLKKGIEFLKKHVENVYEIMQNFVLPGKNEFDVLTHGDCWNNNIMFKHDQETGQILDVKLLDFQMTRHVSPAIDFHYFIYSSPKSIVIEKSYEKLVSVYYSNFVKVLKKKSVPSYFLDRLTLRWFENELKIYSKYGIFTGCWIVKAILAEDHEVIDMDNLNVEFIKEMENKEIAIMPKVAQRLKCILEHYVRRYL